MRPIEIRGLCKTFAAPDGGRRRVLEGLDLTVTAGEVHALLGFSGCGKTTLLRILAGLDTADRGAVRFGNDNVRPRISVMFQEPRLLPWASVRENLALALRRSPLPPAAREERIAAMLDAVGLGGCAALRPAELSGGMAQRAALARALLREPDVLLLDEPLGALDALTRRAMQDELSRLRLSFPHTTLLVTHDVAEAVRLADRASLLGRGRIAATVALGAGADARLLEETLLHDLAALAPPVRASQETTVTTLHVSPSPTRRRLLGGALGLAAAAIVRPASATPAVLNVSTVLRPFNVAQIVMRERGLLEKRLRPLGISVRWHDITSGVVQAEAMASGSLDIASVVNPISVILALANGNPMRIVAGAARVNRIAAIMTMKPEIRAVSDLRGRTVAVLKGTVTEQLLIEALQRARVPLAGVTIIDMPFPQMYAALLVGRVDAAVPAADLILAAKRAGAHEVPTPERLIAPVNVACASETLVTRNPGLVRLYKAAQREAVAFVKTNPAQAIAIGCAANKLGAADGAELYKWQTPFTTLTDADLASLAADEKFLLDIGMCPRKVDLRASLFEAMAT